MAALSASSIEQREEAAIERPQRKIVSEGMSVAVIYDCTQTTPNLSGFKQYIFLLSQFLCVKNPEVA